MIPLLEIAVFNREAAIIAAEAGADRLELCQDYAQGGLTPSPQSIAATVAHVSCPVFVMIRPKPGNFIYTPAELVQMKDELLQAKDCGANGFVFGIVKEDGAIDEAACRELVRLAAPLPCTFHRAFDDLQDKGAGLETLISCGFRRVLSSGGPGGAPANAGTLKALVMQAAGRIVVMPGGGIRAENLEQLAAATGAAEFHSAAITGQSELPDARSIAGMKQCLREPHRS